MYADAVQFHEEALRNAKTSSVWYQALASERGAALDGEEGTIPSLRDPTFAEAALEEIGALVAENEQLKRETGTVGAPGPRSTADALRELLGDNQRLRTLIEEKQ